MRLNVELTDDEAMALAEFCKRHTYEDLRRRAIDDEEHGHMQSAFITIRAGLREKGFNPR